MFGGGFAAVFHALNGLNQFLRVDGFEQVIDRTVPKCLECELVVGRYKNQRKRHPGNGFQYLETVHLRHFNIQKYQIGPVFQNGLYTLVAAGAGGHNINLWAMLQQAEGQQANGIGFVVDNNGAEHGVKSKRAKVRHFGERKFGISGLNRNFYSYPSTRCIPTGIG